MRLRDDLERMIYSIAYVGELQRFRDMVSSSGVPPAMLPEFDRPFFVRHQPGLVDDDRDGRRLDTTCARRAVELAEAAVRLHREVAHGRDEAG